MKTNVVWNVTRCITVLSVLMFQRILRLHYQRWTDT